MKKKKFLLLSMEFLNRSPCESTNCPKVYWSRTLGDGENFGTRKETWKRQKARKREDVERGKKAWQW